MSDMRLVVTGAGGRMGRMMIKIIHETAGVMVAAALERTGSALVGQDAGVLAGLGPIGVPVTDDALEAVVEAEGIIDFTQPAATVDLCALAAQARVAHVVGTTGLSDADLDRLLAASRDPKAALAVGNFMLTKTDRAYGAYEGLANYFLPNQDYFDTRNMLFAVRQWFLANKDVLQNTVQ